MKGKLEMLAQPPVTTGEAGTLSRRVTLYFQEINGAKPLGRIIGKDETRGRNSVRRLFQQSRQKQGSLESKI